MMENRFWDINQTAEYLNVRKCTVYSWVESGQIPCFKLGRMLRFAKEDIDSWAEARRVGKTPGGEKAKATYEGRNTTKNIDDLIKESIAKAKALKHINNSGKSGQTKGLGKEVRNV